MSDDQQNLKIEHQIKLEKRNEAGELFETVEVAADDTGRVTDAKVTQRKVGLAPDDAYAQLPLRVFTIKIDARMMGGDIVDVLRRFGQHFVDQANDFGEDDAPARPEIFMPYSDLTIKPETEKRGER